MCVSSTRLVAAATGPRLPATQEAQFKVTKILDGAFYSIGRLLPEEESPERGVAAPSEGAGSEEKKKKGQESPKRSGETKEEAVESGQGDTKPSRKSAGEETGVSPYLQAKEEPEKSTKGVEGSRKATEERKPLPRRREEEKDNKKRSRSPKRRQEKDKRRRRRGDSRSAEVSGSEVRRQKREPADSQKEKKDRAEEAATKETPIEREPFLRPRPTQRRPRSPHTPERPPPQRSSGAKGESKGKSKGSGWRGRVPYSDHPRWTQGTNKGITKRAKQELQDRKHRGRGGRYHW